MKIISTITGTPSMSKEVDAFLESKLNLQIGTIDWFNYDKDREKNF